MATIQGTRTSVLHSLPQARLSWCPLNVLPLIRQDRVCCSKMAICDDTQHGLGASELHLHHERNCLAACRATLPDLSARRLATAKIVYSCCGKVFEDRRMPRPRPSKRVHDCGDMPKAVRRQLGVWHLQHDLHVRRYVQQPP
jgi:hypothetical protein